MTRSPFYFSVLFLLCAAYLGIILCGRLAGELGVLLGYTSVCLFFVMAAMGIFKLRTKLFKGCSGAMIFFYFLLLLGAIYSNDPLNGLKWKLVGFCTFIAGISLGRTATDISQFRKDMRILLAPLSVGALLMLVEVIRASGVSRLESLGNPNAVAIIAASALCVSAYLAIWDSVKSLRFVSIPTAICYGIALVATGSRGPAGAALMACMILVVPLLMRPLRLAIVGELALIAVSFLLNKVDLEKSVGRLVSVEKWDTSRLDLWAQKFEFNQNWIIGNGGLIEDDGAGRIQWGNMHSIYVQILYELGYCGAALFVLSFVYTFIKSVKLLIHCPLPEKWLAFALIALPMGIGMFESLPLLGNSICTLWWGLGLGLVDQLDYLQKSDPLKKKIEVQTGLRTLKAVPNVSNTFKQMS